VLGEFFAAHGAETDDELLEDGPFERLQTVEAKGLSEVNFPTLGEILQLGAYEDLVNRFDLRGPADNDEAGAQRLGAGGRCPRARRAPIAGTAGP
jgi:hypothetical protein